MQDDTKNADAHFYVDSSGAEMSKEAFFRDLREGYRAGMVYLGGSYVPLRVAVMTTDNYRPRGLNESDVIEAFEEWARRSGREEEIGEDEDFKKAVEEANAAQERGDKNVEWPTPEYEAWIEEIPASAAVLHDTRKPAYWEVELARDLDAEADYAPPAISESVVRVMQRPEVDALYRMFSPGTQEIRVGFAVEEESDKPPYFWNFEDQLPKRPTQILFDARRMNKYQKASGLTQDEYALEIALDAAFDIFMYGQLAQADKIAETWPDEVDRSKGRFVRAWLENDPGDLATHRAVALDEIRRLSELPLIHKRKRWIPEK